MCVSASFYALIPLFFLSRYAAISISENEDGKTVFNDKILFRSQTNNLLIGRLKNWRRQKNMFGADGQAFDLKLVILDEP